MKVNLKIILNTAKASSCSVMVIVIMAVGFKINERVMGFTHEKTVIFTKANGWPMKCMERASCF